MVPLFINNGDWIKVDTRSGDYTERIKSELEGMTHGRNAASRRSSNCETSS